MFLLSFNLKGQRSKRILVTSFFILLIALAIAVAPKLGEKKKNINCDYSTPQAREFFLNMNKLDVNEISSRKIRIPTEFSKTYNEYCEMQNQAGFKLDNYKGKDAVIYTYEVTNYEDSENVRATLVVCGKEIIAADIYLYEQNGFFTALEAKC
ncbi:MAG: DUF4830 domain-containing protein [Oscillospiraceae bacterium]|nr:DUF4830 domain-containing protein [Oscillospiraceae bacterium]